MVSSVWFTLTCGLVGCMGFLQVYGTSGWPYIEEASYKLLIEAILNKQQGSAEDKVNI